MTYPISELAKKFSPWSPSSIGSALECPFKFNSAKKKVKTDYYPDDTEARIGRAIHMYLEKSLLDPEIVKNSNFLFSIYSEHKLCQNEMVKFRLLRQAADASRERIWSYRSKQGLENLATEIRISLGEDLKPVGYFDKGVFLRGNIDCVMWTPDKFMVVIDHKTGSYTDITETYKKQLLNYLMMFYFYKKTELGDPKFSTYFLNVVGGDANILPGELIPAEQFQDAVIMAMLDNIEKAAKSAETNEARPGYYCKYCPYIPICPAGVKL
jgi:CRISPR/Cas system-associated exonuclease Cas4 (RecB family)